MSEKVKFREGNPAVSLCHCGADCGVADETCVGEVSAVGDEEGPDGIWDWIHRCDKHAEEY